MPSIMTAEESLLLSDLACMTINPASGTLDGYVVLLEC